MAGKVANGHAYTTGGRKLRRSASASEQSMNELRYRKTMQYLFDANECNSIDLKQFRNIFGREEVASGQQSSDKQRKQRYRRTQSVTRAEEISTKEEKQRQKQPDKP